jgi:hypothetical protein
MHGAHNEWTPCISIGYRDFQITVNWHAAIRHVSDHRRSPVARSFGNNGPITDQASSEITSRDRHRDSAASRQAAFGNKAYVSIDRAASGDFDRRSVRENSR